MSLNDLRFETVHPNDLKAILCDFTCHGEELTRLHRAVSATEPDDLPVSLLKEWMLKVTESQTAIMLGLASFLQLQVNHMEGPPDMNGSRRM